MVALLLMTISLSIPGLLVSTTCEKKGFRTKFSWFSCQVAIVTGAGNGLGKVGLRESSSLACVTTKADMTYMNIIEQISNSICKQQFCRSFSD